MPHRPRPDYYIRVTTQAEGVHRWPNAPDNEDYLRARHRHLFTVEVCMQVLHDDRETEVNAVTRWLHATVLPSLATDRARPLDFGTQSCEQLAHRIVEHIQEYYGGHRWIECEVLEDGILGAGVRSPALTQQAP